MRTLRHKIIALFYGMQLKWLIYRTKKHIRPGSREWMIYLRNLINKLALPAACLCISPWVDLSFSSPSLITNKPKDYMLPFPQEWIRDAAKAFTGNHDISDPLISPLNGDFRGLPPLLVHTGGDECLLDENILLVQKARAAGMHVESRVWPDMPHDFHMLAWLLPEGKTAINEIGAFAQSRWGSEDGRQRTDDSI